MTIDQFRQDPELVAQLRPILDMPIMKLWLDCMLQASPVNVGVPPDISDTLSHILHGADHGHHRYHNLLISGGMHLVPQQSVEQAAMQLEPEE